jgi:hypothetical protein
MEGTNFSDTIVFPTVITADPCGHVGLASNGGLNASFTKGLALHKN